MVHHQRGVFLHLLDNTPDLILYDAIQIGRSNHHYDDDRSYYDPVPGLDLAWLAQRMARILVVPGELWYMCLLLVYDVSTV